MNVKLVHFDCPGSNGDCPPSGFEVLESDYPSVTKGDFLLDSEVDELRSIGVSVELTEEEADFDPTSVFDVLDDINA